jgi:hypothetical protein
MEPDYPPGTLLNAEVHDYDEVGGGNDYERPDDAEALIGETGDGSSTGTSETETQIRSPGRNSKIPTGTSLASSANATRGSPARSVTSADSSRYNTGPRVAPSVTLIPWEKFPGGDEAGGKGIRWTYDEEILLLWAQSQFYDGKSLRNQWVKILELYRHRFHPERKSTCLTSKIKLVEKQVKGFGLDRLIKEQEVLKLGMGAAYEAFVAELRELSEWDFLC